MSAMRLKEQELRSLGQGEFDLWLELLPGRSVCTVAADSGPVAQKILVAIRDFPEPELTTEQTELCVSEGLKIEDITVRDSRYLPLSDLDLRVLAAQIREFQESFSVGVPNCRWSRLWISGLNSTHPLLEELLQEQLNIPEITDNPYHRKLLLNAFPQVLQNKFAAQMENHPLKAEIIATKLANNIVNDVGFNFVLRMQEETGATVSEIVNAYAVIRGVFGAEELWSKTEALDYRYLRCVFYW